MNIIKVIDPFKPLYTTKKPIILITGGRGGAKSFNTALFLKRVSYLFYTSDDEQC
jgi:phage terminase large subunit